MSETSDILVIGAGALGLAVAAELAGRGHAVSVLDPGEPNASRAAAGMIAPAMEALLDDATPERACLLRRARDLWPDFAARQGVTLYLEGAEWRGPEAARYAARLEAMGFSAGLEGDVLTTPDDWRLDPILACETLASVPGVRLEKGRVERLRRRGGAWAAECGEAAWTARVIVIATGAAAPLDGLSEEVRGLIAGITPIKGQLAYLPGRRAERVVRGTGAYVAPAAGGIVVGATMQPGVRDLAPDLEAGLLQTRRGLDLAGLDEPQALSIQYRTGLRGASVDGLPMAGPSGEPGVFLALAPRRNGWLLAPLVASIVADAVEGATPGVEADLFDPRRFIRLDQAAAKG